MPLDPPIRIEDITMMCPNCGTMIDVMQQRDEGCDYCVKDDPIEIDRYERED